MSVRYSEVMQGANLDNGGTSDTIIKEGTVVPASSKEARALDQQEQDVESCKLSLLNFLCVWRFMTSELAIAKTLCTPLPLQYLLRSYECQFHRSYLCSVDIPNATLVVNIFLQSFPTFFCRISLHNNHTSLTN
jgi:hypothetical protein